MQNRKLKSFIYRVRHDYLTTNNVVLAVALVIATSWAWSSVEAVQRNYQLQREVDNKRRQQHLLELQTENLQFEQRYYESQEYLALEAKRRLGLADPGEKVIVLPPNSDRAKAIDSEDLPQPAATAAPNGQVPPPIQQWLDLLFGNLQNNR